MCVCVCFDVKTYWLCDSLVLRKVAVKQWLETQLHMFK